MFLGRVNALRIDMVLVMLAIPTHRYTEDVEKAVCMGRRKKGKTRLRVILSLEFLVYIQLIFWYIVICATRCISRD